jgi:hypothetical protein
VALAGTQIAHEIWREACLEVETSIRALGISALTYVYAVLMVGLLFLGWTAVTSFINQGIPWPTVIAIGSASLLVAGAGLWSLCGPDLIARIRAVVHHRTAMTARERFRDLIALKQLIDIYGARRPDWDGMGGTAPSRAAISDAKRLLRQLPRRVAAPDQVYAPGDGEVMFQWVRPHLFVEVGFYGDGTISWFARVAGRETVHGDDPIAGGGSILPTQVADALQSIA